MGRQSSAGHAALAWFSNLWDASRVPQVGRPLQGAHGLTGHAQDRATHGFSAVKTWPETPKKESTSAEIENVGDFVVQSRRLCPWRLAEVGLFPVLPAATDIAVTWNWCVMTSGSERQRRDG